MPDRAGSSPSSGTSSRSAAGSAPTRRSAGGASDKAGAKGGKGGKNGRKRLIDYPRAGKRGVRRWLPSWRLVLGAFATFLVLGIGAFVALYILTPVPSVADFAEAQTTTVYYADGQTPMGTFGVQNRVIVPADEIPQVMKDAVVAGEDRSFYRNPGINPIGIARALYTNLRYGEHQGGSTITQQYAERYYFNTTVDTYTGKLKEAILAIKLDRQQDKDEILSNYLNTIYFGRDSYGIETAAQSYFGVGVADLTLSQAALLAGVIPSPNNFDPRVSSEQAERRWNYVLDGMVETGTITQEERDAQVFPETIEYSRSDIYAGPQGYLLSMVRDEITSKAGITDDQLDQRGYTVVTTIDPALQQKIQDSIATVPEDHADNLRIGAVTLDPTDGAILALYGGPDYLTQARNAVTQDRAQAGSTFKPFALTAYLENGGSLQSRYDGNNGYPLPGFPNDKVSNYGGANYGTITVATATAKSVNTVYAQMNDEVGPDKTMDAAVRAGVPESTTGLNAELSNVLGAASPHPLDMAVAYNTFNAQGMRSDPFIVRSVSYLDGQVAYEGATTPKREFAEDVMADVVTALQGPPNAGGTATQTGKIGWPVAGKTGTSTDNKSAWFVGFTRQLTTAVAMYQVGPNGEEESITPFGGYRAITGGSAPADLWAAYMSTAMEGREVLDFPPAANVGTPNTPPQVAVPDLTGMTEADAQTALGRVGLTPAFTQVNDPTVPVGQVVSSDPPAGTEVDQGSTVTVAISQGPGTVEVPDVVGDTKADATAALKAAGFAVTVVEDSDDTVPAGSVISTDPAGGTQAEAGATVTITVSTGPAVEPSPSPTDTVSPTPTPSPTATDAAPGNSGNAGGGGSGG
ncbi:transglycosylase domain-containing protein [Actinotalea sp. M2MS4P-6]|uniref:transglycosylase domain-containing protein n=1 Tax=Actinotalea sp. M2MS4P-6 TaxID=2983762 RepID=UPI0021E3E2CB|nr:transglycosylase domain-containing protein [Actinotalea sp. M2MS4P-6]MCV2392863.1 transglycosylase domain-containing protein [Actinotalea sp. M2MS4P-6]